MSATARRDFPDPDDPRISTARAPTRTADAWTVGFCFISRRTLACSPALGSHRRQAHHETCTEHFRPFFRRYAHAIFGADAPALRLHDLARDREPESGIVAESLMRPVGVEALEDALHRFRLNARTVVV